MTQEDKQLLLQDLCARLPYGVKVHLSRKHNRPEEDIVLNNIIIGKDGFVASNIIGYNYLLSEIKPYLRPISSMTEEEKMMQRSKMRYEGYFVNHVYYHTLEEFEYLNSIHVDYRGLIEKGLALEALDGMYND